MALTSRLVLMSTQVRNMFKEGRVRRAFSKSGVRNQVWSVLVVDQLSVAATSSFAANIVQASDWAAILGQRATMKCSGPA